MVSEQLLILLTFGYLLVLFGLGWFGDRFHLKGKSLVNNPYAYALSLTVYCTAWTFYGSIERMAAGGYDFLTIYLGPTLMAPLLWVILRKMIRISKVEKISSLADLISSRYGKSATVGVLVTLFSILGILPYIALQLKAIGKSYRLLTTDSVFDTVSQSEYILGDSLFYMTIGLAFFIILFGTKTIETAGQHHGLLTVISFEAIIKLIAFLVVGGFVSWFVFDGFEDIFDRISKQEELRSLLDFGQNTSNIQWFWLTSLSMLAILFLPRQFQVAVVENLDENHLKKAMWLFPFYLLAINIFVIPIALGGKLAFFDSQVGTDIYILAFPLSFDQPAMAMLVYLGGFSAATSMMILSTFVLSTMVSNNLLMPALAPLAGARKMDFSKWLIYARRATILLLLLLAYAFDRYVVEDFPLVSIGLISFVAVAQFAPATLGGLFWKGGTRNGAISAISLGFLMWGVTLFIPAMVASGYLPETIMTDGLFGLDWLRPYHLLGLEDLDPITHAMFWTLVPNAFAFVFVSNATTQSTNERNQAELFVDIYQYSNDYTLQVSWKGKAKTTELTSLLKRILGWQRAEELLGDYSDNYGSDWKEKTQASSAFVKFIEHSLAGAIGAAAARIMISHEVEEDKIAMGEVYTILRESQELMNLNKQLSDKSADLKKATEELKTANELLLKMDAQKNDFISTVTHELKTPLTAIRAFSEILHDNDDLTLDERKQFLETVILETERMTRLINQVLELEKMESGALDMQLQMTSIKEVAEEAIHAVRQLLGERRLVQSFETNQQLDLLIDKDRIKQVLLNLLSNAVKYTDPISGYITVGITSDENNITVNVSDNGKGISEENKEMIFMKFFQDKGQNLKKPQGTGLGLAISKQIVELHNGRIWVTTTPGKGCDFYFTLPINSTPDE